MPLLPPIRTVTTVSGGTCSLKRPRARQLELCMAAAGASVRRTRRGRGHGHAAVPSEPFFKLPLLTRSTSSLGMVSVILMGRARRARGPSHPCVCLRTEHCHLPTQSNEYYQLELEYLECWQCAHNLKHESGPARACANCTDSGREAARSTASSCIGDSDTEQSK